MESLRKRTSPHSPSEILGRVGREAAQLRRLGVRELGLFGSCARQGTSEAGDLDFVVRFGRKSFDAFMDLKFLLEDMFGKKVDLVLKDAIKARLRDRILEETVYVEGL